MFINEPGVATHPSPGPVSYSNLFLSSSLDWTVRLCSVREQTPLNVFDDYSECVYDVCWSPIHPALFAAVDGTGRVDVWNLNNDVECRRKLSESWRRRVDYFGSGASQLEVHEPGDLKLHLFPLTPIPPQISLRCHYLACTRHRSISRSHFSLQALKSFFAFKAIYLSFSSTILNVVSCAMIGMMVNIL
ncbi:unnamed protein product [Dibothriocephalus latus]|uniref:Uncharacterized protein n=1 Tax=Dibothriocephalus latus TaxID=60516 RepID=A0A3P7P113_DIBLA|nr:unnamed protein product [Dibothriocephalus latus]